MPAENVYAAPVRDNPVLLRSMRRIMGFTTESSTSAVAKPRNRPHIVVPHPTSILELLRLVQRILAHYRVRLLTLVTPLRALGYECRNFAHRIGSIWRSPIYRGGLQIGSEYHSVPSADFQPCDRIRDCISDITSLRRARPWITLADEEIFLEGWRQGVAAHGCRLCIQNERS